MKEVFSALKHEILIDGDILYCILVFHHQIKITSFDLETLEEITSFDINIDVTDSLHACLDDTFIYLADAEANLVSIDRITGEIQNKIQLKSLSIGRIILDDDFLYVLSVLPVKNKVTNFSTYFIQKVSKKTSEIQKFAYHNGNPTQQLVLAEDRLFCSDPSNIYCCDKNGQVLWSSSLRAYMNHRLAHNDKYILTTSAAGGVQGFELTSGHNVFSIQMSKALCEPAFQNSLLCWVSERVIKNVNIEKARKKISHWQTTETLDIEDPMYCTFYNDKIIVADAGGNIIIGKEMYKIGEYPVIYAEKIGKRLLYETINKVHILDQHL